MNEDRRHFMCLLLLLAGLLGYGVAVQADFNPSPVGWDAAFEADPDNTDSLSQADDHIRQIKTENRSRLETDLDFGEFGNVVTDTGRLLSGAARAFWQNTAPTVDGTITAACLTETDYDGNQGCDGGRVWIDADGPDNIASNADDNTVYVCADTDADGDCDAWQATALPSTGLALTGGTLTGALILNADPVVALGAATKQYVDAQIVPGLNTSYAHLRDEEAAGTDAGGCTSGAWRTRTLNTEVTDADGIVSVAANQFTLQAGTYGIIASAPAYRVGSHVAKLYNITDGADEIIGTVEQTSSTNSVTTRSFVTGEFTIGGAKVFELQHRCGVTRGADGFGLAANLGVTEVYTDVQIWLRN